MAKAYNNILQNKYSFLDPVQVLVITFSAIPGLLIILSDLIVSGFSVSIFTFIGTAVLLLIPPISYGITKKIKKHFKDRDEWLVLTFDFFKYYKNSLSKEYNHNE